MAMTKPRGVALKYTYVAICTSKAATVPGKCAACHAFAFSVPFYGCLLCPCAVHNHAGHGVLDRSLCQVQLAICMGECGGCTAGEPYSWCATRQLDASSFVDDSCFETLAFGNIQMARYQETMRMFTTDAAKLFAACRTSIIELHGEN